MEERDRPNQAGRDFLKDRGIDPDRFQEFLDALPLEARRLFVSLIEARKGPMIQLSPDCPASVRLLYLNSRMTPAEHEKWLSERPRQDPGPGRRTRPKKPPDPAG